MARRDGMEDVAVLDRPVGDVKPEDADTSTEDDTEDEKPAPRAAKRNSDDLPDDEVISLNVRVPNGLRKAIAITAQDRQTSVPQLIAEMLSDAYSYALPKPTRAPRTKKYANKEERLAAQKAQQAKNRAITKAILAAVEEGKIDMDIEALLAEMQAKQGATAAAAAN